LVEAAVVLEAIDLDCKLIWELSPETIDTPVNAELELAEGILTPVNATLPELEEWPETIVTPVNAELPEFPEPSVLAVERV